MFTRREYLKLAMAAGISTAIHPIRSWADDRPRALIRRAIPGRDETLPVVGLGSSASFAQMATEGNIEGIRDVLQTFTEHGGQVFDTAPSYASAEEAAANVAQKLGVVDQLFWATKVNVARGGKADPKEAQAQIDRSIQRLKKPRMDLIQVHNLGDVPTQLSILKEYRDAGKIRYIGVTTTFPRQYDELEKIMQAEPLDFIGVDYAIDHRVMEDRIFPLAMDRGIGVLAYQPFGRSRLWRKVEGFELPDWAGEYDIHTWGQFFLKFVVSHPAVTVATPATRRPRHIIDNLGAATGALPDEAGRQRMIAYLQSL